MAGLLKGRKISGRHQTYIKAAAPFIQNAKKETYIKKIVIGPVEPIRGKSKKIKISQTPTSLKMEVYAANERQTLWFIGDRSAIQTWAEAFQF